MPHFHIRGASAETGEDVEFIVFAADESGARHVVSDAGIFTLTATVLDADGESRPDDGEPTALLRLGTALSRQGRYDEALVAIRQAIREYHAAGVQVGIDVLLRVPRYQLDSGRWDEAWGTLQHMKLGRLPGLGEFGLIPHDLAEIHVRLSRMVNGPQVRAHEAVAFACFRINDFWVGHIGRKDAIGGVTEAIRKANPDAFEPVATAERLLGHLPEGRDSKPVQDFLWAAFGAEKAVWAAIQTAPDWT